MKFCRSHLQLQNRLLPQLKCTPKKTLLKADTLKDGISPLVAESALFCLSFVPKQIHSFFSGLEMMHKGLQSHPAHRKPYRSLRKRSGLSYTTCFHWEFICSLGDLFAGQLLLICFGTFLGLQKVWRAQPQALGFAVLWAHTSVEQAKYPNALFLMFP